MQKQNTQYLFWSHFWGSGVILEQEQKVLSTTLTPLHASNSNIFALSPSDVWLDSYPDPTLSIHALVHFSLAWLLAAAAKPSSAAPASLVPTGSSFTLATSMPSLSLWPCPLFYPMPRLQSIALQLFYTKMVFLLSCFLNFLPFKKAVLFMKERYY